MKASPRKRERLLFVAPTMPSDRGNGLAMRAGFFLDAYSTRFDIDLVVAPIAGTAGISSFARSRASRIEVLELSRPDTQFQLLSSVRDQAARLEAFHQYGRPSLAAFIGALRAPLLSFVGDTSYRAIHVFRLYLAELATDLVSINPKASLLIDCDEDDAFTLHRIAAMYRRCQDLFAAEWAEAEARAFAKLGEAQLPKFDVVFAASQHDARLLRRAAKNTHIIPNPLSRSKSASRGARQRGVPTILFVGSLGYAPNADAVLWFASRVWPRLTRRLGGRVRWLIVGRDPPAAVTRLQSRPGIEVTGSVLEVGDFYRQADIAIVPLRAGSGTRIKLIEAAAQGIPIVATRLGAEGTGFMHTRDILLADGEENLLRACLTLLQNRSVSRRLATNARSRASREYSPSYWQAKLLVRFDEKN